MELHTRSVGPASGRPAGGSPSSSLVSGSSGTAQPPPAHTPTGRRSSKKRKRYDDSSDDGPWSDAAGSSSGASSYSSSRGSRNRRSQRVAASGQPPSSRSCPVRVRKNLSAEATEVLKAWMLHPTNVRSPYPDDETKLNLAKQCSLSPKQLTNWFTNARKRWWAPMMRKQGHDIVTTNNKSVVATEVALIDLEQLVTQCGIAAGAPAAIVALCNISPRSSCFKPVATPKARARRSSHSEYSKGDAGEAGDGAQPSQPARLSTAPPTPSSAPIGRLMPTPASAKPTTPSRRVLPYDYEAACDGLIYSHDLVGCDLAGSSYDPRSPAKASPSPAAVRSVAPSPSSLVPTTLRWLRQGTDALPHRRLAMAAAPLPSSRTALAATPPPKVRSRRPPRGSSSGGSFLHSLECSRAAMFAHDVTHWRRRQGHAMPVTAQASDNMAEFLSTLT